MTKHNLSSGTSDVPRQSTLRWSAKLNGHCRRALEGAAGLCLSRTNYNVEIEHWLMKLLEGGGTDLEAILKRFEIDQSRMNRDLTKALDGLKTGNASKPALSQRLFDLVQQAWLVASVEFGSAEIRSGHLVYALVADRTFAGDLKDLSSELRKLSAETLQKELPTITAGTLEGSLTAAAGPTDAGPAATAGERQDAGARSVHDRPDAAGQGREDRPGARPRSGNPPDHRHPDAPPAEQSDPHRRSGRRQNGRRRRLCPAHRRRRRAAAAANHGLRTLDLGLLQAGAGVKGEFENRLKSVIEEVKRRRRRSSCSSTKPTR